MIFSVILKMQHMIRDFNAVFRYDWILNGGGMLIYPLILAVIMNTSILFDLTGAIAISIVFFKQARFHLLEIYTSMLTKENRRIAQESLKL